MKYPNVLLNSMTSKLLLKDDKDAKIRKIRQFLKNLFLIKKKANTVEVNNFRPIVYFKSLFSIKLSIK